MTIAWLQMVRAHGFSELATEYNTRINAIDPPPARQKTTISSADTELIRAATVKLAEEALQICGVQHSQKAILALLCWGTSSEQCPQRRSDFRLLKYSDVSVIDGKAVLRFSCSAKVGAVASVSP